MDYDFLTKLYTSHRTYRKQLDEYWALFNPDFPGLPVVVSDVVYQLYCCFDEGEFIATAYDRFLTLNTFSNEEIQAWLLFLINNDFLRLKPTPIKYEAEDFPHPDDLEFLTLWLHITNDCNFSCDYCFVEEKDSSKMEQDTIERLVYQIGNTVKKRRIKVLNLKFAGGEPCLAMNNIKRFYSLIQKELAETEVFINVALLSNGSLINDNVINFLKQPNIYIFISLDGYGAESHDIYRTFKNSGTGSWNVISENIDTLLENNIRPFILSTISKQSCESLKDLVAWIFGKGLQTRLGVVNQAGTTWTDKKSVEHEYKEYTKKLINNFEQAFVELEKPNYKLDLAHDALLINDIQFSVPSFRACCHIGTKHIVIDHKGKLSCCPMKINTANVSITDDDIATSIRETVDFSTADRNTSKSGQTCLHCQWFPACVGGCLVTNKKLYNDTFAVAPLHDFYAYVIPRYIDFYGKKLIQQAQKDNISDYHILKG